ncbi:MAG: nucleotidyltransferase domain-containing protein [Candidatus Parabeggiatoa sp.]|nr:nucleotidyltransferase domain-containing protein [Candidatus Parabeggiatoa sp.]HIE02824.1 nucleotidyltransferase domain-containing protein [Thiotrichaceae bacterium]
MRLSQKEVQSIKQTIHIFDPKALIYLFGSRVDDTKKGGDIDLLVLSKKLGFMEKIRIKIKLYELIGEQKIDLIIAENTLKPFVQIIQEKAMLL